MEVVHRYYECSAMTLYSYLESTSELSFVSKEYGPNYVATFNINVREEINRGYFKDRPELRKKLNIYLNQYGIDYVMDHIIPIWVNKGMLNQCGSLKGYPSKHVVLYNGDAEYRHKYCCHRKLIEILKRDGLYGKYKTTLRRTRKHLLNQAVTRYKKREKPLEVECRAKIGIKGEETPVKYRSGNPNTGYALCLEKFKYIDPTGAVKTSERTRVVKRRGIESKEGRIHLSDLDVAMYQSLLGGYDPYSWIFYHSTPTLFEKVKAFYNLMQRKYRLPMTD